MKELDSIRKAEWMRWICRNSLGGVKEQDLLSVMTYRGMSDDQARELLDEVKLSPIFQAAQPVSWRARNLEAVLNVQLALEAQDGSRTQVDRCRDLSREDFHRNYYALNRPVVLEGLMDKWPALSNWKPEYFRERLGDMEIEIQSSRKSFPVYEVFLKGHSKTVTMTEFVAMILKGDSTNSFYLTANDRFLERPGAEILLNDFWPFPEYLSSEARKGQQFLWFGPSGAVSPLHRDRLNVLMTQVYGRKRVKLIPSSALHLVYNYESFFSEVDCEDPDLEKYPLFAHAPIVDVELGPGDALLIPVGWWHHVKALETSINVSFTNFVFPNDFERFYGHQLNSK